MMRSKFNYLLIFLVLLCSCGTVRKQGSTFILASNESHIFDDALYNIDLKTYCYAFPFETNFKNMESDLSFYPYYPLRISPSNDEEFTELMIKKDDETMIKAIPCYESKLPDGSTKNPINAIRIEPYTNKNNFKYYNHITKTFVDKTGIFISQRLFETLGLKNTKDSLEITATVLCPVVATKKEVVQDFNGEEISQTKYSIIEFDEIEYTFKVEGVIDGVNTHMVEGIAIPYEISKEIFDQRNVDIHLEEDCIIWKPVTWIVESQKEIHRDQLSETLHQQISNYVIADYYTTILFERDLYN